jgi:hypothetical protein
MFSVPHQVLKIENFLKQKGKNPPPWILPVKKAFLHNFSTNLALQNVEKFFEKILIL